MTWAPLSALRGDIGTLPYHSDFFRRSAQLTSPPKLPGRAGTLFPIILYVNLYCGMLKNPSSGMILALFHFPDHLIQFGNRSLEA